MATEHHCGDEGWQPGGVDQCDKHGQRIHGMPKMRLSAKQRRKEDTVAGTKGVDRGNYIHGPEGQ